MRAPATSLGPRVLDAALWSMAVGLLAATFVLSLDVAPPGLNTFFASDKLIHAAGYAALTESWLLAAVWRPGPGKRPFPHAAWAIVVGAVVLGLGIELAQRFVHRNTDPFDALADAGGVLVAAWAWVALRRRMGRPAAAASPGTQR